MIHLIYQGFHRCPTQPDGYEDRHIHFMWRGRWSLSPSGHWYNTKWRSGRPPKDVRRPDGKPHTFPRAARIALREHARAAETTTRLLTAGHPQPDGVDVDGEFLYWYGRSDTSRYFYKTGVWA